MKTVGGLGGCDCGGKVILDVEAVSPRGVIGRRALTADVDAGLGLMSCVRRFSQLATQQLCRRSEVAQEVLLISSQRS